MAAKTRKRPAKKRARKRARTARRATRGRKRQSQSLFAANDGDVERWLATGERRSQLEDYFGPEQLRELEDLARESMRSRVRGGPKVLVLPGLMGSKLGYRRKLLPDDVIWIDPIDAVTGGLGKLTLPDRGSIKALGVLLFAYLKLKLRLRVAGFDAEFYPFDWRQSIRALGGDLAQTIAAGPPVQLVAHSMGGMIARAALTHASASKNVKSLVMLGTPNFGSFSPVQALRADHDLASKLAAIDLSHSALELARDVFATFPGLIELLPSQERWTGIDLYKATAWPDDKPRPTQASLDSARQVQREALAGADERFFVIAGVAQETVVDFGVDGEGKGFYETSREGDGTVPLAFCELPKAKTYYVEESHGSLPNNGTVESAVIDLFRTGATDRLPTSWIRSATRARRTRYRAATPVAFEGRRGVALTSVDRRRIVEEFAAPDACTPSPMSAARPITDERPPGPGMSHLLRNVEVTRRRAHAIEICLALGSITEARSRALALGVFRGVDPAGAAGAIDQRLEGAVKEAVTRRMFSAEVGSVFVVPVGRHLLYADNVLFAGLGAFDAFQHESQQFVAENTMRIFVRSNVEDFATTLFGAGSGWSVPTVLANQLRGFIRGILDADHEHRTRRITICELDRERYREMKEELYRLASTELFDELVVTFDEVELPEPLIAGVSAGATGAPRNAVLTSSPDIAYLIVNREENPRPRGKSEFEVYRASVLTKGHKATVVSGSCSVDIRKLDAHLKKLESSRFGPDSLRSFGEELGRLVLEPIVARVLQETRGCHLAVVHDAVSSRIPWETLCISGWFPAAEAGLSRRYSAENLSAAKWLDERRKDELINLLLIANPTEDLEGADAEFERVRKFFPPSAAVRVNDRLHGARATREAVLAELGSGKYDVVHYAGHAFFDPEQRSRSGILCHGDQVLSGAHLAELRSLPSLAFFNACESARVRSRRDQRRPETAMQPRIQRNVGLAEAFLRGGIANYVGTYWPVGDDAAETFATTFYGLLVRGESIGGAIQTARGAVRKAGSIDWADYVHYGTQDFSIKTPS
jgi:pimeloyl-ACP methyl ester carboxylesterase